jgi:glycosyltransferase involved in cell wall biosynthesis
MANRLSTNRYAGLVLFFTKGVSLATWAKIGYLNREAVYYRRLGEALGGVTWVTYGRQEDQQIARSLAGINVVSNLRGLPPAQFAGRIGDEIRQHRGGLRVLKTNQLPGAYEAYLAHRRSRIPLVVRCGNVRNYWILQSKSKAKRRIADWLRLQRALLAAYRVLVPTAEEASFARRHFILPQSRIRIIPNFVPTDLFRPDEGAKRKGLLGFVGIFKDHKNLPALLRAVADIPDARLRLIGEGGKKAQLAALADQLSVDVKFVPYQRHEDLPRYLNECEVFVFPSLYEGHPKALLEAMACGLPVVTTPVYGIRRLITHGVNGYLCADTSPEAIRQGLQQVLEDEQLRHRMGQAARQFVVERFAMPVVLEQELQVYRELGWVD